MTQPGKVRFEPCAFRSPDGSLTPDHRGSEMSGNLLNSCLTAIRKSHVHSMASQAAVLGTRKYNVSPSKRHVPLSETTVRMEHSSVCYSITTGGKKQTGTARHILFLVTGEVSHSHVNSLKRVNLTVTITKHED